VIHRACQSFNEIKNPKFWRTPQRPQPVFNSNRVSVHLTFFCHECTHFAWLIHTYVVACGSNTLLWSVVRLYSHYVIQSVYTWHLYGILLLLVHTLYLALFSVQIDTPTHTCGAHTVLGSVQSLFTLGLCTQLHCTTVQSLLPAWPLFCQPITEELLSDWSVSPPPRPVDTALLLCRTDRVKKWG
jgi:hypothetical protein